MLTGSVSKHERSSFVTVTAEVRSLMKRYIEQELMLPPSAAPATEAAAPEAEAASVTRRQPVDAAAGKAEAATSETASRRAPPPTPVDPIAAMTGSAEKLAAMRKLVAEHAECRRCPLAAFRSRLVFGSGSLEAGLMVIGEGPGEAEDAAGLPFIGPAGELLTKMLGAIGLGRDQVFIANVVKCRPEKNRAPVEEEAEACRPLLAAQIRIIKPRLILTLGGVATRALSGSDEKIGKVRGRLFQFEGMACLPTYHPAFLLRAPHNKRAAWNDLQQARDLLAAGNRP